MKKKYSRRKKTTIEKEVNEMGMRRLGRGGRVREEETVI